MKTLITVCLFLAIAFTSHAQENQKEDCDCPKRIGGRFTNLCTLVENKDLSYKEELMEMACADRKKDSPETIRLKVNCMFEKYYAEFGCQSIGFTVAYGNILKYAVNNEFAVFIDGMVKNFRININKKDPDDGKTLLDFVDDEINRYKNDKNYQFKVQELKEIYNHFKNDLNAKHSNQLTPQDGLPYSLKKLKISVTNDILKKYEGKYIAEGYNPIYIKLENDNLLFSIGDDAKYFELSADSKNSFFRKPTPAFANSEFTFIFNKVSGTYDLILNQISYNIIAKRIE